MKHYNTLRTYLLAGILAAGIAMVITVRILSQDMVLTVVSASFAGALLLLSLCAVSNSERYIRRTVILLSDLLASITALESEPAFSATEDTLLSKLQNQVLRLTGILKTHRIDAQRREKEIKSLVSDISHQLKTPVAAMKMYGELLQDDSITEEERREYLASMTVSMEKLEFLMDSLIKVSRLESHIVRLRPEYSKIGPIVLDAIMQCHAGAKQKQIDIRFDGSDSDISLACDKRWTCEAIFNVLDNAVKYTPCGGLVEIVLQRYEMFCRLDIRDSGIGIPAGEQEKIFQRFYRVENASAEEGLGLGLYLTRKILTGQGGYIKVVPQKKGSMFSLFLPL